jgi:hypothetical protein
LRQPWLRAADEAGEKRDLLELEASGFRGARDPNAADPANVRVTEGADRAVVHDDEP